MVDRMRIGLRPVMPKASAGVSYPAGLAAGIGAGIAAGVVNVVLVVATRSRIPPVMATAGSSLVAGGVGGLVYAWWNRISPRAVAALWVTCLLVATIDTIVVFMLPFPTAARHVHIAPLAGLVTPLLQLLALAGIGGFSRGHLPPWSHGIYLALHYVTAAVVSVLVPIFARPRAG
jgi:hypothetical protein